MAYYDDPNTRFDRTRLVNRAIPSLFETHGWVDFMLVIPTDGANAFVLACREKFPFPDRPYVIWEHSIHSGLHSGIYDLNLLEALAILEKRVERGY